MSLQKDVKKRKYRNWVRGGLAYKYLTEGIKGFADDVVHKEHNRILQVANNISGLTCNQCCLRHLRPLHTCKKDHAGRNKCPWGQNSCNCLYTKKQPCPNKICDAIMEEILKSHGSTPPSPNWKYTDIQKWCSDPWEIAKCFVNAPGYSDKSKVDDIDSPGLLHVFIDNINHRTHLSDKMNKSGMFQKTLQRRNELFHSPTMEMEDSKLDECIDDIIAILEDKKELKARHDAQEAVLKLKQLKQENFIITTHNEAEVCRDALTSVTNKTEELKQTIQDAKDDIAKKQAEATEAVGDETKKVLRDTLGESDNQTETLYERVGRLESENSNTKRRLTILEGKVDKLDTIRQNHQKQLNYVERKQALQNGLVKLYQQHYVKTSISPLKSRENDISINEVYVSPEMAVEAQTKSNDGKDRKVQTRTPERRYIHGYREIFQTNGQKHKAIYVVGDVGTGKSSFCKMMIHNWCTAFTDNSVNIVTGSNCGSSSETDTGATCEDIKESDTLDNKLSSEYSWSPTLDTSDSDWSTVSTSDTSDSEWSTVSTSESESDDYFQHSDNQSSNADDGNINEIRNFDFLFFVPLQKMSGLSDLIEMIKAIVTDAGLASDDVIDGILARESERCLIVADGLDEWTLPKDKCRLPHVSYGLPKRDRAKHATVITLSRPSAKGILNMKFSECDKKVELLGINIKSVKCFIEKYLSKPDNKDISSRAFMKKIKSVKHKHLEKNPLLLQQLVWLYCHENEIGKSMSDTYSHIINIILGWSQNKEEEENREDNQIGDTDENKDEKLPGMLHKFDRLEANKRFLLPLARVAFEALTSETVSHTLGLKHLLKSNMSNDCIATLITLGILVEENCFDPTKENTRLAFSHLAYLEFFAAVHVSGQYNKDKCSVHQNTILEDLFRNCNSAADILQLSNVLIMICGLSPNIISELSKRISDIVSEGESMIIHRNSLSEYWWDRPNQELEQIQRLVFNCLSEGDSDDQPKISLCAVIIYRDTDMSVLHRIIPENVLYLYASNILDVKVWRSIAQLKRLKYLYIVYCTFPHSELVWLSSFIQETPLRCLTLDGVNCTQSDCEGHTIDLSKHDQLQSLEFVDCHQVIIPKINSKHLETFRLGSFSILGLELLLNALNASSLTKLHLGHEYFTYSKQVASVVHTLHHLRQLRLDWVSIDSNALTVTPEMRNLEHIGLFEVNASLETWRTFVDSLLTLQQSVSVCVSVSVFDLVDSLLTLQQSLSTSVYLSQYLHELGRSVPYEIDENIGNYIRQNKLFEVIVENENYLVFSTRK